MSTANGFNALLAEYLELFAHTEIFIFVFMEIITRIATIQRVIFKKAMMKDYIIFVTVFGLFSIFGTYIGSPESSGAITNIRDLAPMVAGLVGGPVVGTAVGLIGGIHRLLLGGATCVPCSLATIFAGLIAGLVYKLNKGKMLGIIPAILFAASIELLHAGVVLLIISPFTFGLEIVLETIPQMIIAVSLGMGISAVIINSIKEPAHLMGKSNDSGCSSPKLDETTNSILLGEKRILTYFLVWLRTLTFIKRFQEHP